MQIHSALNAYLEAWTLAGYSQLGLVSFCVNVRLASWAGAAEQFGLRPLN